MIEIAESLKPVWALACPASASVLILLTGHRPNLRESWTLIASVIQFAIVFSMVPITLISQRSSTRQITALGLHAQPKMKPK